MKSTSIQYEGVLVYFTNENGKIYRVSETVSGYPMHKGYVFGVGKVPYVKAYNHKNYLDAEEIKLMNQVA